MEALASDSHDIFYFCLDVSGMASNQNSKAGKQKKLCAISEEKHSHGIRFCISYGNHLGMMVFGIARLKYKEDQEN